MTAVYPHDHGRLPPLDADVAATRPKLDFIYTPTVTPPAVRAEALAQIRQMDADLRTAHQRIAELERALQQSEDRWVIVNEERIRYRMEARVYRDKLVRLAANQTQIKRMVEQADAMLLEIDAILAKETPEDHVDAHKTKLPEHALVNAVNEAAHAISAALEPSAAASAKETNAGAPV